MRKLLRAGSLAIAWSISLCGHAADPAIPPSLQDWQGWVLHGQEYRRCPFASGDGLGSAGEPIPMQDFRCVWPERLTLDVDARGGSFSQRWIVHAASWVQLPGDAEHWPRDVRLDGNAAPVVFHDGRPSLRLAAGTHAVSGRFSWSTRPESLSLPRQTAIVELTVDGARVAQPERPNGGVWLGKRRTTEQAAAMEVQVYRLVQDDIPAYLLTRIRLNVAGEAREELLARVLPDGFTPVALHGDLPARLERDGTLRVQVRAGSHEVQLRARGAGIAEALSRPPAGDGQWPREEIWSFAGNDLLRVVAAEGAEGIDPAQANVPADWREYPAFRMDAQATLRIVERSRGLANVDDNQLRLQRSLWLDFDHRGYTVVDHVSGIMRRDWRLDMSPPFDLKSAKQNEDQLLVTQGADNRAGVELRQPSVNLTAISRTEAGGSLPAAGWDSRFDAVAGTVYLPHGHLLLAVLGADTAPGSWWERWGLWNVFGVLLIVGFVYWVAGLVPAVIAAVALLLTYQDAPPYIWLWGNLLAAIAVARAAPEGRFRRFARGYRTTSFVVLGLALLPFLGMQVRLALYPQLAVEQSGSYGAASGDPVSNPYGVEALWNESSPLERLLRRDEPLPAKARVLEDSVAAYEPLPALAAPPAPVESDTAGDRAAGKEISGINTVGVVPRYAAGTVLQAGPGIPAWRANPYHFAWHGPVETSDTVRFLYVGPVVMFLWRLLGVIGLVALFGWLALLSYGRSIKLPGLSRRLAPAGIGAAAMLAFLVVTGAPEAAAAAPAPQDPGGDVLAQLQQRLIAGPSCAPSCAELMSARVLIEGERLEVVLQVSALANLAMAMPHASDRWQLDDVTLNGRGTLAMARDDDATLWVPLPPGAHTVRLAGRLASAETVQLAFPQKPRVIDVTARGWTTSGVNEGRLVSGSLELARERSAGTSSQGLRAGVEFPAYVKVHRRFSLDLDWSLHTTVERVAPQRAALALEVPLVPGESVLTSGVQVRDRSVALVGLGTGEDTVSWRSGLIRADTLELSLPAEAARAEEWTFLVNPQWNVEFEGFPPVLPEDVNAAQWRFRFIPRPGETLRVSVARPKAVKGTTLAIDSMHQSTTIGARSSNTKLSFLYRSTQGGRHVIKLSAAARVTRVMLDERPQQIRPERGELPLQLAPGEHRFTIDWEESRDVGLLTRPSSLDLGAPASNLGLSIEMPDSRWVLATWGPGAGPAVLYWGEVIVFVLIAWLLSRWAHSPLRFHEWLLLGLGLSTQSWFAFVTTAIWLALMRWREGWRPVEINRWRFNLLQVALAVFTFFTVLTLLFAGIRTGLLAQPDMNVQGDGSGYGRYAWFQDQTTGVVAGPTIFSVPLWVYRALFFAWAVWIAFALVRWLRWAFDAWKSGGLWRGK
jgi:hypothetical protein